MWRSAERSPHLHHFRICPMREAIKLRNTSLSSSLSSSNDSYTSRIPVLSQSTLSLRSCHNIQNLRNVKQLWITYV
ncbi:unnamed protein product [Oppiella nova]|uniref:Uncharacterized protein n=1 Tax=Oppiella nova TaxID=334625 RepID=A0A7R9M475_9ACAR|nr:unnamed protein product [Oppiella nova]CAG2169120.1 unnamed protein product [Oppiella nova]